MTDAAPTEPRTAPVIEWYRPDTTRGVRRALLPAALLMTLGSLALAHTIVFRGGPDVGDGPPPPRGAFLSPAGVPSPGEVLFLGGGLALIAGGGLYAFIGLRREMGNDTSLVVRTDGLHWQGPHGEDQAFVDWYDIERVDFDPDRGALSFPRRDGGPPLVLTERFADAPGADLAKRLEDLRRKAIFGLLPR